MVRKGGFEPPRAEAHKLLRLARLPVPPLPQSGDMIIEQDGDYIGRSENGSIH